MDMTYLQIFADKAELLEPFSLEERGELLTAMVAYAFRGEEYVLETNARYVWPVFRQMIDQSRAAIERLTENGKKGGRPKSQNNQEETKENQTETKENQTETKPEPNETQNNHYQESRIKNQESRYKNQESLEVKGGEAPPTPPKRVRFSPPSVQDVQDYCQERGNRVDAQRFVDFYAAKGWKVGAQPMRDWKAAVRTWEQRDSKPPPIKQVTQGAYSQRPHKENDLAELDKLMAEYGRAAYG